MGRQTFKYILFCMLTFLLLAAIEIFLLKPVIECFGNQLITNVIIYLILFIIVNPVIIILLDKLWFKFEPERIEDNSNKQQG